MHYFCSCDNWLCNLISENSYVLAALKQKYYKMHACADLQMLQYHHLVPIYGYIVLNIVTIYKFIYIPVESQCDAEPVYSDSQYLQVCSGKNCNCSSTAISSVSCFAVLCIYHSSILHVENNSSFIILYLNLFVVSSLP